MGTFWGYFFPAGVDLTDPKMREQCGARAGQVGIGVNLLLFAAKLAIGLISGAISIVADALNNLSDAGSSLVMLLGFRIAARPADPEHPFGHGRVEYLTGLFVAVVILFVGFQLLQSSVVKILHPEDLAVDWVAGAVLLLSVFGKLALAHFYQIVGDRIQSAAIRAAAADSRSDCLATAAVLLSLILYVGTGWNVDGAAGGFVALFILYSGWEAVKSTAQPLMGEAPDPALVSAIKKFVLATPPIIGVHDLIIHDYGPGRVFVSLHAEVPGNMEIMAAHTAIDALEQRLEAHFHVEVTVHMDPVLLDDPETNRLRLLTDNIVQAIEPTLTTHDFRLTTTAEGGRNFIFDVVVPYGVPLSDEEIAHAIGEQLKALNPHYQAVIHFDHQYC
ncbi:MAG: cation diffusion facilitator family transporter [Negativicutes bacterium]